MKPGPNPYAMSGAEATADANRDAPNRRFVANSGNAANFHVRRNPTTAEIRSLGCVGSVMALGRAFGVDGFNSNIAKKFYRKKNLP